MKVLFVHHDLGRRRFVEDDVKILQKKYNVKEVIIGGRFINILLAFMDVARSELVFAWFASWHSFFYVLFAKLLRKPSIVVAGGYDVVSMPEIDYGLMRGGVKKIIAKIVLQAASVIICFSKFSKDEAVKNGGVSEEKIKVVYLGVEYEEMENSFTKENLVITVGNVFMGNLKRKGLEGFVRSAEFLPDVQFVLIGKQEDDAIGYLKSIASSNVEFTGFISKKELQEYMERATVYVQVSAHEGFGLAVAEAMSFECVPVVTKAGAIPEIVGDTGIYVPFDKPKEIAEGIREAPLNRDLGVKARERIIQNFPLEKREKEIYRIIDDLIL